MMTIVSPQKVLMPLINSEPIQIALSILAMPVTFRFAIVVHAVAFGHLRRIAFSTPTTLTSGRRASTQVRTATTSTTEGLFAAWSRLALRFQSFVPFPSSLPYSDYVYSRRSYTKVATAFISFYGGQRVFWFYS